MAKHTFTRGNGSRVFHHTFTLLSRIQALSHSYRQRKKRCRFCDGFTLSISKDDEEYWLMLVNNLMHASMRIFCPKHITLVPAYKFGYYEQSTGSQLTISSVTRSSTLGPAYNKFGYYEQYSGSHLQQVWLL